VSLSSGLLFLASPNGARPKAEENRAAGASEMDGQARAGSWRVCGNTRVNRACPARSRTERDIAKTKCPRPDNQKGGFAFAAAIVRR
jgi:hypothetical protein